MGDAQVMVRARETEDFTHTHKGSPKIFGAKAVSPNKERRRTERRVSGNENVCDEIMTLPKGLEPSILSILKLQTKFQPGQLRNFFPQ